MFGLATKTLSSIHYTLLNGKYRLTLIKNIKSKSGNVQCLSLLVCRFAAAFALRQRMLNFVQNIQYYMMFEVMEPTWHIMENNLKTVNY